jgi:hypothetical protein
MVVTGKDQRIVAQLKAGVPWLWQARAKSRPIMPKFFIYIKQGKNYANCGRGSL